jgi:hypothetical protein
MKKSVSLSRFFAAGLLSMGAGPAAMALTLTGSSVSWEFDNTTLGAPGGAVPGFGNGLAIANGGVLVNPAAGFPTLAAAGSTFFSSGGTAAGGAAAALPPNGMSFNTGLQFDQVNLSGDLAQSIVSGISTSYGGGGVWYQPGTFALSTAGALNTAAVSVTAVNATFRNQAAASISLLTGSYFGIRGFVPDGDYIAGGLTSSVSYPGQGAFTIPNISFAIGGGQLIGPGIPGGPVTGTDYVKANNQAVGFGGVNNLYVGLTEQRNVQVGVILGTMYSLYAVSLGGTLNLPANSEDITVNSSLTLISDPGATMTFDPSLIPEQTLPGIGVDDPQIAPEPGAVTLLAVGLTVLAGVRRRAAGRG